METNEWSDDAGKQLAGLDGAAAAVKRGGYPRSPWWYWFALASLGPALVAFETQSGPLRRFAPAVIAALLVGAVSLHTHRRMQVRPKRSLRSGAEFLSSFAFIFSLMVGLQLASALGDSGPFRAAIVSYGYLVAASAFFGRRTEAVVWANATPAP